MSVRKEQQENKPNFVTRITNNLKEVIAVSVNVLTIVFLFLTNSKTVGSYNFTIVVESLNLVTLIAALIMLSRKYNLKLIVKQDENGNEIKEAEVLAKFETLKTISKDDEQYNYYPKPSRFTQTTQRIRQFFGYKIYPAYIEEYRIKQVQGRIIRINTVVKQLINNHRGFAVSLAFLYALLLTFDINSRIDKEKKDKALSIITKQMDSLKTKQNNLKKYDFALLREYDTINNKNTKAQRNAHTKPKQVTKLDSSNLRINNLHYQEFYRELMHRYNDSTQWSKELSTLQCKKDSISKLDSNKINNLNKASLVSLSGDPIAVRYTATYLISILADIFFNILSACFLFIAFLVLYANTVDETNNTTSNINYMPTFAIAGAIYLFIVLTILIGLHNTDLQVLIVGARIMSGIFNGVGMALLFSRFISMEYFFKGSNTFIRLFYSLGTIVILPIYAVVQPLFGLFETNYAGNQDFIKAVVLLFCLWGKVFFFLLVYTMLQRRWIHAYIYTLKFSEQRIKEITDSIDNIEP